MAPLSQGAEPRHTRGFVYFQYGNALSIVFIYYSCAVNAKIIKLTGPK